MDSSNELKKYSEKTSMNNHTYSLEYVLLTLRLVIKHLNFDEEDIFRYGSDKDQPPLEALKEYITLILKKQKSEDSLSQFIFDFNHAPENINKKLEITPNTLSKLSQEVMIHGCLIDKYNLRVNSAWTLLCNQLYIPWSLLDSSTALSNTVQAKSKTFSTYLKENKFQLVFNDFLNTLCAIGYEQTAEAFHLFLHITYLVTLHEENNQTTKEGMAKIQSICLTNGLELEGVLSKIDPSEKTPHYTALLKQENVLFSEMVGSLASCPQFSKTFSIKDYQPGITAEFKSTLDAIVSKNWSQPNITAVPYSHDIFGAISESESYVSPLPFIDDNSEIITNELRSRSQSPRAPERHKKSFELFRKKAARSEDLPSKSRKISTEKPNSKDKKTDTNKSRMHSSLPDLTHELNTTTPEPQPKKEKTKPVLPLLKIGSDPVQVPKQKSPIRKSPHSLDRDKPNNQLSSIVGSSPLTVTFRSHSSSSEKSNEEHLSKPELSLKEILGMPGDIDQLTQMLQSLTFNIKVSDDTEETDDTNDFYHRRRDSKERRAKPSSPKKKDEHKSEGEPLLYQYTGVPDSEQPKTPKTLKRHVSKSKLHPSGAQDTSLK